MPESRKDRRIRDENWQQYSARHKYQSYSNKDKGSNSHDESVSDIRNNDTYISNDRGRLTNFKTKERSHFLKDIRIFWV